MVGRVAVVVVAVLSSVSVACDAPAPRTPQEPARWRTSGDPVDAGGLAWAVGSTVHLSDGTEVDTGARVRFFVVAGDGVFFVPGGPRGAGAGAAGDHELAFVAPGEPAVGTGMVVSSPTYVAASPDGRHLAVLDLENGEEDRYGTPQATVLAFDLETGEQVIDSSLALGDPATDDFADGYSESEIGLSAMTDTDVYLQGYDDVVLDLATGEGADLAGAEPARVLTQAMRREQRRIREDAAPARVLFPAWTMDR